jgi:hypothetical protein
MWDPLSRRPKSQYAWLLKCTMEWSTASIGKEKAPYCGLAARFPSRCSSCVTCAFFPSPIHFLYGWMTCSDGWKQRDWVVVGETNKSKAAKRRETATGVMAEAADRPPGPSPSAVRTEGSSALCGADSNSKSTSIFLYSPLALSCYAQESQRKARHVVDGRWLQTLRLRPRARWFVTHLRKDINPTPDKAHPSVPYFSV